MRSVERENIGIVQAGEGLGEPLVRHQTERKIESEFQHLTDAQRQAVRKVLESRDRFTGLQGAAGAGKTTTLAAVRRAAEAEGYQVQGFAPTSRAAHQLEDAGISSTTLQHFLTQSRPNQGDQRRLYVLDESSLASTRLVNDFFKRLQQKDRVLLVGDTRQHQAVEAGRPFQQLQEAGMRTVKLDEILRQKNQELKNVVEALAQGEVGQAVRSLERQGRVHGISDAGQRLEAVVNDYLRQREGTFVVAPDNRSRSQINDLVHEKLKAEGALGPQEYTVTVLVNRQDLTGADRQWAAQYDSGDVVRYTRGSRQNGIEAGEYATVTAIDRTQNLITVRRQDGEEITYDPRRLQGVNVYRPEERNFAEGERIQLTAPFKQERVPNRELATIERIDASGDLQVRLDSGRTVRFNLRDHSHIDYGYAMTSYSSQGQTADRVLVHLATDRDNPGLVNSRFAYVALSRARHDAQIYTDNAATLGERLSREVSKTTALEEQQAAQGQWQRSTHTQRQDQGEQRLA